MSEQTAHIAGLSADELGAAGTARPAAHRRLDRLSQRLSTAPFARATLQAVLCACVLPLLAGLAAPLLWAGDDPQQLRQQLQELLLKYTERHPDVVQLRQRLRAAEAAAGGGQQALAAWDFSAPAHNWNVNGDVLRAEMSAQGLRLAVAGVDPWLESPALPSSSGKGVRVTIRMRSSTASYGQLFYGERFRERDSVRFEVAGDGRLHTYTIDLPPLRAGDRLRLDPVARKGQVVLATIHVETLPSLAGPALTSPQRPVASGGPAYRIESGLLQWVHYGKTWNDYVLQVEGEEMAAGHTAAQLGYVAAGRAVWVPLDRAVLDTVVPPASDHLTLRAYVDDPDGARWVLRRTLRPGRAAGTIEVEAELSVSAERDLLHVPWVTLFPGLGTYGTAKHQAVFPGLEYLADEPSSSSADVNPSRAVRRVPEPSKITIPLMALGRNDRFVGLDWDPDTDVAAIFDSPDRTLGSRAHLMALWAPRVGPLRTENALYAHAPFRLAAGQRLRMRYRYTGGRGMRATDAVEHWVAAHGWPDVAEEPRRPGSVVALLARGWLDSGIGHDGLWRHALWGDRYGPRAAADAPVFMAWLAARTREPGLRERLRRAAADSLAKIPSDAGLTTAVGHIRRPVAPLVFGRVAESAAAFLAAAEVHVQRFDAKGMRHYRPPPEGPDLGSTHSASHASGLAAADLEPILQAAAFTGDPTLTATALDYLDKMRQAYSGSVPRGAQPWEIPLHAPDLLASARLVSCFVWGYELTGDRGYLDEAAAWAWTGVPFVYLAQPTSGRIGRYATIPALAASKWNLDAWFGVPVQWVGLVYADALQRLARYLPDGPWSALARNITMVALAMTTDTGLLPDWFELDRQAGDGPLINPGTVQALLPAMWGDKPLYDIVREPSTGWLVQAPGRVSVSGQVTEGATVELSVDGWPEDPYYVLVAGIRRQPRAVTIGGNRTVRIVPITGTAGPADADATYDTRLGLLAIPVAGSQSIRIETDER